MVVEDPIYPIWEHSIFKDKLVAACSKPSVNAHNEVANSKSIRKSTPALFFLPQRAITNAKAKRPDNIRTKKSRVNSKFISMIKLPYL